MQTEARHFGKVAQQINPIQVAINRGSSDGVDLGDKFLIYRMGDEVLDPDTGESLGPIEIVIGRAKATHVQEKIATLESLETRRVAKPRNALASFMTPEYEDVPVSLEAEIGDFVKPI